MRIANWLFYGKPQKVTRLNIEQLGAEIRDMGGKAELRHTRLDSCMYGSVKTTDVWTNVPQETILRCVNEYTPQGGFMRVHSQFGKTHSIIINACPSQEQLELRNTERVLFPSISGDADALIIKRPRHPIIARTTEFLKRCIDGIYAEVRCHTGEIPA